MMFTSVDLKVYAIKYCVMFQKGELCNFGAPEPVLRMNSSPHV